MNPGFESRPASSTFVALVLSSVSGALFGLRIESLRRDVRVVRPDDRAGPGVGAELAEVGGIAEGLEDAAVVEEVREVDIRGKAVVEADVDDIAFGGFGVDQ